LNDSRKWPIQAGREGGEITYNYFTQKV